MIKDNASEAAMEGQADTANRTGLSEGARPRYVLDDLLAGMTPQAMHEAFDWGSDAGRERVDE